VIVVAVAAAVVVVAAVEEEAGVAVGPEVSTGAAEIAAPSTTGRRESTPTSKWSTSTTASCTMTTAWTDVRRSTFGARRNPGVGGKSKRSSQTTGRGPGGVAVASAAVAVPACLASLLTGCDLNFSSGSPFWMVASEEEADVVTSTS